MKFYTPKEAALVTSRHPETVTQALRLGELCGSQRKKNGRWLIEESCLFAWVRVESCAHKAKTEKVAA